MKVETEMSCVYLDMCKYLKNMYKSSQFSKASLSSQNSHNCRPLLVTRIIFIVKILFFRIHLPWVQTCYHVLATDVHVFIQKGRGKVLAHKRILHYHHEEMMELVVAKNFKDEDFIIIIITSSFLMYLCQGKSAPFLRNQS